jgi:DNA-directed RNA polymerase alpha subunit
MNINILEKEPYFLKFEINEHSNLVEISSVYNALRRIMISDVPTMAIEVVKIIKNSGVLPDESLSHRLGLIPIKSNKFGPDSILSLSLNAKSASNEIQTVYSSELKIDSSDLNEDLCDLVPKDYIITKLINNQEISLKAIAVMGTGYTHAKWSPSCGTTFISSDSSDSSDNSDNSDKYTFLVETTSALTADELFSRSISILREKLTKLEQSL